MKKNIFIGIFSPLFYFLIVNIIRFTILAGESNEQYALLHNILILLLPALPGTLLIFLLIRKSTKEYFESLSICFMISFVVMIVYMFSGIELKIYTAITGYEELSLGDGLITVITMVSYLVSCLVGTTVAGIITYVKKRKTTRIIEN